MEATTQVPLLTQAALIGLGEAGSLLAKGFVEAGLSVSAYDIKIHESTQAARMQERARDCGVTLHATLQEAIAGAQLIVSAVTASSAAEAAVQASAYLGTGQFFLDINSVSPATKRHDQAAVEASGAFYVESAVMAPVPPYGIKVPMLLGGPQAEPLAQALNRLGLQTRAVATNVGVASAIKMCRSVMIKGLEALTVECMTAARRYGAEQAVLESLAETFPSMGWTEQLPHYLISRVAEHGRRRAAEMREVVETLEDVHLDPIMASATARAQDALVDRMEALGITYPVDQKFDWPSFVDRLSKGEERKA